MTKKLQYYCDMTTDIMETDAKERDIDFRAFKRILDVDWELPTELSGMDWMRSMKTSGPADGMDAAIRTFSNILPTLHIHASNTSDGEHQRVEAMEDALMYHFNKANKRGVHSPLELILQSVIEYGCVGAQVRYLPYDFKKEKKGARVKAMLAQGDFAYIVHEPISMHPIVSPYGLETMVVAKLRSVADLKRQFGDDINELIDKLKLKKSKDNLEETFVTFYDLCDYEDRVQWASLEARAKGDTTVDPTGGTDDGSVEIFRGPHKLPFIPFVYEAGRKPMLKTLVDSHAWEDQNILKSLQYALLVSTVAQPRAFSTTFNGEGIKMDYTDPGAQAKGHVGEELRVLQAPQTDANLEKQVREGEAAITQTLQTRALQAAADIAGSAPFATYNAILQTAVGSMSSQQIVAERILEGIFVQEMRWIKYSGIPLLAKRLKNRTGWTMNNSLAAGSSIALGDISGGIDFDPDALMVRVKLRADTPTDEQARLNKSVMLIEKMGFSVEDSLEAVGLEEMERSQQSYMDEKFGQAMISSKVKEIMAETDLKIQKAMLEMQNEMQQKAMQAQQPPPNGGEQAPPDSGLSQQQRLQQMMSQLSPQGPSNQSPEQMAAGLNKGAMFDNMKGQGFNPAQGGENPLVPGVTRNSITGTADNGQEMPQ